jgi:hypothetical protein
VNRARQSVRCFPVSLPSCSPFAARTSTYVPVSLLFATLASHSQFHENKGTLSPAVATLTSRVKPKPFVCHSYGKHRGWGYTRPAIEQVLLRAPGPTGDTPGHTSDSPRDVASGVSVRKISEREPSQHDTVRTSVQHTPASGASKTASHARLPDPSYPASAEFPCWKGFPKAGTSARYFPRDLFR